jgi:hypothetical protein
MTSDDIAHPNMEIPPITAPPEDTAKSPKQAAGRLADLHAG